MKLFALEGSQELGAKVARELGVSLSSHKVHVFDDGEFKVWSPERVRGSHVFVLNSLYMDANWSIHDRLCKLWFFIAALKDADAFQVTAVVPYLAYARKDRKTTAQDPVTTRYVAALFESVGADRVVTCDVHNLSAFQNAFRCQTFHLEAVDLFAKRFAPLLETEEPVVVSPDPGGVKRANRFRKRLEQLAKRKIPLGFMEKYRSQEEVTGEKIVGDITGRCVIIYDDMISTGNTLLRTINACRQKKASRIYAAAVHGVFTEEAKRQLANKGLEKLIITDTLPQDRLVSGFSANEVEVLSTAELFAREINNIYSASRTH